MKLDILAIVWAISGIALIALPAFHRDPKGAAVCFFFASFAAAIKYINEG